MHYSTLFARDTSACFSGVNCRFQLEIMASHRWNYPNFPLSVTISVSQSPIWGFLERPGQKDSKFPTPAYTCAVSASTHEHTVHQKFSEKPWSDLFSFNWSAPCLSIAREQIWLFLHLFTPSKFAGCVNRRLTTLNSCITISFLFSHLFVFPAVATIWIYEVWILTSRLVMLLMFLLDHFTGVISRGAFPFLFSNLGNDPSTPVLSA